VSRVRVLIGNALRALFRPVLRWFRVRFEDLERGIAGIRDGQVDLADQQRMALEARDGDVEVIGRVLAQQRVAIERLEAEIRDLRAELCSDRHERPPSGPAESRATAAGR